MASKMVSIKRDPGLITVLDIGSDSIRCVAGEVSDGILRYRGHGSAESKGIRRGQIVELDKASAAMETCKAADDKLTPVKFLLANVGHAGNLKKKLDTLASQTNEDSRNQAKTVRQVVETLRRLTADAAAFTERSRKE